VTATNDFDHFHVPLDERGTAWGHFEELQRAAAEDGTSVNWSDKHDGFWYPTEWATAKAIFQNPTVFSQKDLTFPRYATPDDRPFMLSGYDEPAHSMYRNLAQPMFTPGDAAALEEQLRASANARIDEFLASGRIDVSQAFTEELPGRMTAILLGLPEEDGAMYRSWTRAIGHLVFADPEAAKPLLQQERDYFNELLADRRANPGDDLMSRLIHAELPEGRKLTDSEVEDFFTVMLLGGIDNTALLFGATLWRLAWDKPLRQRLIDDPTLIPSTFEEFLRLYASAGVGRHVEEDISVGGVEMKKGQKVMLIPQLLGRDPREFPNPSEVDPVRKPNRHLGLGLGIHRCIGAHIIRVEGRVAIEEWLRRIPVFDLDPERPSHWLQGQICGLDSVNVVFPQGGGDPGPGWTPEQEIARIEGASVSA
jgi:cytochrome P450